MIFGKQTFDFKQLKMNRFIFDVKQLKINKFIYFEKTNKNKYLTLVPTIESKEKIKIYEKLWSKIRNLFRSVFKN